MRWHRKARQLRILILAVFLTIPASFAAWADSEAPVALHMDVNSQPVSVYNGYTSYVVGQRASEEDTFTVTNEEGGVDLSDVTLNYYLITYNGDSQKYLECTVHGLRPGVHYPVVRPETVRRERANGELYDYLERCYMVEFEWGDTQKTYYFSLYPEDEMDGYRNLRLGRWEDNKKGWRYRYEGQYLTSWIQVDDTWYYMDADGYMETGWMEYKNNWYYLDPATGAMRTNCTIDGFQLNADGIRV